MGAPGRIKYKKFKRYLIICLKYLKYDYNPTVNSLLSVIDILIKRVHDYTLDFFLLKEYT